jgi:hypothetical protein
MVEDENTWPNLSLALAMRGMEDEDMPEYTLADLRERFSPRDGALSSPAHSTIEWFRGEYEEHVWDAWCVKSVLNQVSDQHRRHDRGRFTYRQEQSRSDRGW